GNGRMPRSPFSEWSTTSTPSGMKFATSAGIPMPRFTYSPSFSSRAARRTRPSRESGILDLPLRRDRPLLDPLLVVRTLEDPLHEHARRVHEIGIELAPLH